jgi:predicted ATPase
LSTVQSGEYPTAMLVRRELQSWKQLHLEGSALRRSDSLTAPVRMGNDGSHLAAALHHLARRAAAGNGNSGEAHEAAVYARVANRLAELIDDVRDVSVTRDEAHQRFVLHLRSGDGTMHQASALSDGTLRFLALAVTEFDSEGSGAVCFEEPENGIHPRRIPAMLRLLEDIATDPSYPVGSDNPLRQVIINTHSPSVVQQAPDDSLLIAELVGGVRSGPPSEGASALRYKHLQFGCLPGTWRAKQAPGHRVTSKTTLLAYLNPAMLERCQSAGSTRVLDRPDVQMFLPLPKGE